MGGLTDTAKYTGAHKERFDDSGKGKGIDGREYRQDDKGYVTGYKGDGTFEEKWHKLFIIRGIRDFYRTFILYILIKWILSFIVLSFNKTPFNIVENITW